MKIEFVQEGSTLTASIEGSIDTITATELENQLEAKRDGITTLILDFSAVAYVSSSGLRALLIANKYMAKCGGTMVIKNVNSDVREVFEMTGFDTIFNIE